MLVSEEGLDSEGKVSNIIAPPTVAVSLIIQTTKYSTIPERPAKGSHRTKKRTVKKSLLLM